MTVVSNINSNKQRLYQEIASKILALIDSGEYPVDSRLPAERELAERFGVSRPTIREAIIALKAKDRVTVKTGSGVYVSGQEAGNYNHGKAIGPFELVEARARIEGEAAALAASVITDEQLLELEQVLNEMKKENLLGNETSTTADKRFHSIISQATHNQLFSVFIDQLWKIQEESEHIKIVHQGVCKHDIEARLDEHKKIFDALVERDPHKARIAMRSHFSRLLNALHRTTEEQTVREVKDKILQNKKRFSLDRIVEL